MAVEKQSILKRAKNPQIGQHRNPMKKPEIKSYSISDFPGPADDDPWVPDDRTYFEFWMQVAIGIEGEAGADNFTVHVVSQKMLPRIERKQYLLVVPYFESMSSIVRLIEQSIGHCAGSNWEDISSCISKLYYWEYHHYTP